MSSIDIILPDPELYPHRNSLYTTLTSEIVAAFGLSPSLSSSGKFSPFECKQILWSSMARRGIQVPSEIFDGLQPTDSLEMWSVETDPEPAGRFIFAIGDILKRSSYSLEQLATIPWNELFHRDPIYSQQLLEGTARALATNETQYELIDWHIVSEALAVSPLRSESFADLTVSIARRRPWHLRYRKSSAAERELRRSK